MWLFRPKKERATYLLSVESVMVTREDAESKQPAGPAEEEPEETQLRMVTRENVAVERLTTTQPPAVSADCKALPEPTARPLIIDRSLTDTVELVIVNARAIMGIPLSEQKNRGGTKTGRTNDVNERRTDIFSIQNSLLSASADDGELNICKIQLEAAKGAALSRNKR
jgi:hypothetical protein